jgi:ATP-dependent DNA helicase HFM1/MER3
MDLECIDLSFTDDEEDDIFRSIGDPSFGKRGGKISSEPAPSSPANGEERPLDSKTAASSQGVPSKQTLARKEGEATTQLPARKFDNADDCFDEDDFSIFEETLPTGTPTNAGAFKSGASDDVLYQGISKKFAPTGAGSSPGLGPGKHAPLTTPRVENSNEPSSSLFVDGTPGMSPDISPQSSAAAEPVVSPTADAAKEGKTAAGGGGEESKGKVVKESDEPAWVAEFDPEFVDMFRGYVTFV